MKTIKGPAVFLAQFIDQKAPFNSLEGLCRWAADLGYKGIQIPTWETFLIDLYKAARAKIIATSSGVKSPHSDSKSLNSRPTCKVN